MQARGRILFSFATFMVVTMVAFPLPLHGAEWEGFCDSLSDILGGECYDGTITPDDIEDAFVKGRLSKMSDEEIDTFKVLCQMSRLSRAKGLTKAGTMFDLHEECRGSFRGRSESTEMQGLE